MNYLQVDPLSPPHQQHHPRLSPPHQHHLLYLKIFSVSTLLRVGKADLGAWDQKIGTGTFRIVLAKAGRCHTEGQPNQVPAHKLKISQKVFKTSERGPDINLFMIDD